MRLNWASGSEGSLSFLEGLISADATSDFLATEAITEAL